MPEKNSMAHTMLFFFDRGHSSRSLFLHCERVAISLLDVSLFAKSFSRALFKNL